MDLYPNAPDLLQTVCASGLMRDIDPLIAELSYINFHPLEVAAKVK